MTDGVAVVVPLLSANEPEAVVVSLARVEGDEVAIGDVIAVVENTKSTEEVLAAASGWVVGLRAGAGATVQAGDVLCWIGPDATWRPLVEAPATDAQAEDDVPSGLRISRPALALARELRVDLSTLPIGPLVTAEVVRNAAGASSSPAPAASDVPVDAGRIVVLGGGGHGRTLVELIRAAKIYEVSGIVDDGLVAGAEVSGVTVVGGRDVLARLRSQGMGLAVNGIGGIGRPRDREAGFDLLAAAGYSCPPVVHPSAVVEPSASIGAGAQVLARAYVGSDAVVGFGCLLNTASVVSHDCRLEPHVNISPGALLAGAVVVGRGALIGMGVTVNIGVRVGAQARVGNGAVVKADVPDGAVVRAGSVWP